MSDAKNNPRVQFIGLLQFQHELNEIMMRSLDLDRREVWQEVSMWAEHVREELDIAQAADPIAAMHECMKDA